MEVLIRESLTAFGLLAGLLLAGEVGYHLARRKGSSDSDRTQIGAIQGAILGLVALLLGFSFAGAASRFIDRQDLIVAEANAVGTSYLRADLLDDESRDALQSALRLCTTKRIELFRILDPKEGQAAINEIRDLQDQIWAAASAGAQARPQFAAVVLPPVNELIDLHATQINAAKRHLPPPVLALLIACSLLGVGTIGFSTGLAGKRQIVLVTSLAALMATALWITLDLDYPRVGLIKLSAAPLHDVLNDMNDG